MAKIPRARVLVADDEEPILNILEHELNGIGCETVKAKNGREAVDRAAEVSPDLVLLDIQMPVMNGFDACKAIRKAIATRLTPILFVTSMDRPEQIVRGFEAGANDYIIKPFNRLELRARVNTHLGIRQMLKDAASTEKRRSLLTLTGGLCHELLNPLQLILGHLSILDTDPRAEPFGERIAAMSRGAVRIQKVLSSLQEYSKESEGAAVSVDLNALLEQSLELTRPMLEEHHLRVEVALANELPKVQGIPGHLTQVFVQLLSNAAVHVPEGGKVEVSSGTDQNSVYARVKDSGPGMSPKEQEQIFDPFFTNKVVWNSLGLGLSVAQRIVTDHGGAFEVHSQVGEGSEFRVVLPGLS
jgi:signal transduction histidine kinase